jgi:DnaK suppressor protein
MSTTTKTPKERRNHKLESMLVERGRELRHDVQGRIRSARSDSSRESDVLDEAEACELDVQTEIDFVLLQIKVEALTAIDAAVRRIGAGTYGDCAECGGDIHEARLRALPFAVRCRECEEVREMAAPGGRTPASRRDAPAPFVEG